MTANEYRFLTHWRFQATAGEVRDILTGDGLDRWWPSVYLDVRVLEPGDDDGVGKVVSLYTKGWLPYTLRWSFRVTESRKPASFGPRGVGRLRRHGVWTLTEGDGQTDVTYDWRVRADKLLLRRLSWLMRPLFAANHRWAMARGEESLRLELARRRAPTPEDAARVPPPPGPTFPHRRKPNPPVV